MIDKNQLTLTVEEALRDTDLFLVDVSVTPDNRITVEIDSPEGVDIDTCVALSRKIEAAFDREAEDYELEVGSAGLTSPLKVKGQYDKNIGHEVEVMLREGGQEALRCAAVGERRSFGDLSADNPQGASRGQEETRDGGGNRHRKARRHQPCHSGDRLQVSRGFGINIIDDLFTIK